MTPTTVVRAPGRRGPAHHRPPRPPRPPNPPRRARRSPSPTVRDPRPRLAVLLVALCLAFAGLAVRLVDVQALSAGRYSTMGRQQRFDTVDLPARRGSILDRNGAVLAVSVARRAVWADPRLVDDPAAAARALAPLLKVDEARLRDRLSGSGAFVYLARQVDEEVVERIRALGLPAIGFEDDSERVQPAGSLAASVLGMVGTENTGLAGLEKQYEEVLGGRPGKLVFERDPAGNQIAAGERERVAPSPGRDVVLTIDRDLQYGVEDALASSIVALGAKGGIAVVMDPATGEILAMANLVAASSGRKAVDAGYNKALIDVFEPGSVSKAVTLAGALESRAVRVGEHFEVPDRLRVADATFREYEDHPTEWWTPTDIMAASSNVGTIMIGQRLGAAGLDHYLRAFGFASTTGLGFPGESAGLVPALDRWSGTSLATLALGQGLAVNAVQMLAAYNTVANGGEYVVPTLVRAVSDPAGRPQPAPAPARQRVVSPETAAAVAGMLEQVVVRGTGTAAAVDGYRVAGKTGTARKVVEGRAGYKDGAYVASFTGFLPVGAPRLSVMVALDEPTPYTGGQAAAPVFAEIARFAARHLAVVPAPAAAGAPGAKAPAASLPSSPTRP